ncbi:MAG: hypothetical protein HY774_01905 [Acidobacteria bacterium]|nr:hypothetical protein [Acidobacteriota bacterium]
MSSKPVHKESSMVLEGSPSAEQDPDLMIALVRRTLFAPGFDLAKEGWVEQLSARYLTQSERHIVEFMAGSKKIMSWTKLWAYSFVTTLGISLCLFILPYIVLFWDSLISRVGPINLIILFAALKIVAFLGMCCLALSAIAATLLFCLPPMMSFLFDGFRLYRTSEKTIPMYAVYPIGFWPMIRIQWKLSLVRLVLSFPAICSFSFGVNSVFRLTPGLGVELAFKCIGILLIITVLGLLLAFSDGTTSNVISIYKIINGIGIILTGVGIFRLTDATMHGTIWQFFSVWLVMITLLFLWLMVVGKLYNQGKVDLLGKAA